MGTRLRLPSGMAAVVALSVFTQAFADPCPGGPACPEQRHLSYGQEPDQMVVMWVTPQEVKSPTCQFGLSEDLNVGQRVRASSARIWQLGGIEEVSHTCELTGLSPGRRYFYQVGDEATGIWSALASFMAKPDWSTWSPTMLVYGDFGVENDVSLPRLVNETEAGGVDFVLHVGDMAYDLYSNGGRVGQAFMRNIDPIASRLPYMTCLGNHEGGTDIDHVSPLYHYMHRFMMPGSGDLVHGRKGNNVYYSFDVGPAHIIAFSSEVYFWQLWDVESQYEFLKRDLSAVDRTKTPWVITMAHRPMYCSNTDGDDCSKVASNLRTGLPFLGERMYRLEELFHEHKVDLAFWAHEHSYERTWPVFDNQVFNGTESPYVNPGATVHIVSGATGCREGHDSFAGPRGPWSAFRYPLYGYGKLRVENTTHLYWQQVGADQGEVIDEMWLVKTKVHSPKLPLGKKVIVDPPADVQAEQRRREAIYAWSKGCTQRHAYPQDNCTAKPAGSLEVSV